jgi:hypothetical protein
MDMAAIEQPKSADWLREAGGMLLYGSIGSEAYLRPDGTVWYYSAVDWVNDPDKYVWHQGHGNERWAALVLGSRRIPELEELLPVRPPDTPNCARCDGRGEIFVSRQSDGRDRGIICPDCGALGWITTGAA